MYTKHDETLFLELTSLENHGVTIWLDDLPSTSKHVTDELTINDENSYMRDYVFDEGVLKEVHFDKIKTTTEQ